MILCWHCKTKPVAGKQRMYCGPECYRLAKLIRERSRKTPPKPSARVITCLGPCGRPFLSPYPKYIRVCDRCKLGFSYLTAINGCYA